MEVCEIIEFWLSILISSEVEKIETKHDKITQSSVIKGENRRTRHIPSERVLLKKFMGNTYDQKMNA